MSNDQITPETTTPSIPLPPPVAPKPKVATRHKWMIGGAALIGVLVIASAAFGHDEKSNDGGVGEAGVRSAFSTLDSDEQSTLCDIFDADRDLFFVMLDSEIDTPVSHADMAKAMEASC